MPFNGSGTYTPPPASFPAVTDTIIDASKYNAVINDIAAGLSGCLLRDGTSAMSGDLDVGGNSILNLGAGSVSAPTFGWDGDNGFYLKAANEVGVAIGGSLRAWFRAAGMEIDGTVVADEFQGNFTGTLTGSASAVVNAARTGVKGLVANPASYTSTSTMTISCTEAVLVNSSGATKRITGVADVTCNINTSGPVAGGRDQSAAFSSTAEVHFYLIYNGTTVNAVCSTSTPSAGGPVLPTGYTYYVYIFSITLVSGALLGVEFVRGNRVFAQGLFAGSSAAASTTESTQTITGVPTIATRIHGNLLVNVDHGTAEVLFVIYIRRPTGYGNWFQYRFDIRSQVIGVAYMNNYQLELENLGAQYTVQWTAVPAIGSTQFTVNGYDVPNGDS